MSRAIAQQRQFVLHFVGDEDLPSHPCGTDDEEWAPHLVPHLHCVGRSSRKKRSSGGNSSVSASRSAALRWSGRGSF